MALFRKKKKDVVADNEPEVPVVDTSIGGSKPFGAVPPVVESDPEPTLSEVIIGMSDVEYRAQVLSLLMECNQKLINFEDKFNALLQSLDKYHQQILEEARK